MMKTRHGLIRMTALLVCLVMIGMLLPISALALSKPVLVSAKAEGTTIKVTWNAVAGATGYMVYRKYGTTGWKSIGKTAGTTYTDKNAQEKVTYTYTVRAMTGDTIDSDFDKTGVSAAWNKTSAGYTATPKLVSAKANSTGIKVTWQKVNGATGYRIYRTKTEGKNWVAIKDVGNVDNYQDNSAVSKTKYWYTVRSLKGTDVKSDYDKKGVSATWDSGIAPGDIAAPKLVSAVAEGAGIRVTWNAVGGAAAYRVYRKYGNKDWVGLVDVNGTTYLDNSANADTTYTYTVRCLNGSKKVISSFDKNGVKASWSAPTPGDLATPVLNTLTCAVDGLTITWGAVPDADGYRVYRDAGSGWVAIADVAATTYTDTTVNSGTTYKYTVRAMKSGKVASSFNKSGLKRTFYATPVLKTAKSNGDGITVTWEASKGAPLYRVFRKIGLGDFSGIGVTKNTSFTDKKVSVGVEYTYTVRVVSAEDEKTPLSNYDHTGISCTFTGKSGITSLVNKLNGVQIEWAEVDGVVEYQVQRKSGEGDWVELSRETGTSYLDTSAVNNTTHCYRVRALDAADEVIGSYDVNGVSITFYSAPTLVSCVRSNGGLLVTWEAVEGVSNYIVYRKYSDVGEFEKVGTSTGTTYLDTTAPSGTFCRYTVRCANASGTSISWFETPGVGTESYWDQPVLKAAANEDGTITVTWHSVDKASYYRIYRKDGSKTSWDAQDDVSVLEWTDTNVVPGTTYTYSVSVIDSIGGDELSEFNSTGVKATYYDPPALDTVTNGKTGVDITWIKVDYIGTYHIYRKTGNDTDWVSVGTATGTKLTDTNVKSNAHYTYVVRGMVGGADATGNSAELDTTYYAAPTVTSIACNNGSITIKWSAIPGIEKYRIYCDIDGAGFVAIDDVNATTYTDLTANTQGTKYTYTVRCMDGTNVVSAFNSWKSATYMAPPTGIGGSSPATKKAKITWNPRYGVKSYTVKRKTATTNWVTVKTGITSGSYIDTVPSAGNYIYCVVAVAADGTNSAISAMKTITVN